MPHTCHREEGISPELSYLIDLDYYNFVGHSKINFMTTPDHSCDLIDDGESLEGTVGSYCRANGVLCGGSAHSASKRSNSASEIVCTHRRCW
jgi:hypothetical protein